MRNYKVFTTRSRFSCKSRCIIQKCIIEFADGFENDEIYDIFFRINKNKIYTDVIVKFFSNNEEYDVRVEFPDTNNVWLISDDVVDILNTTNTIKIQLVFAYYKILGCVSNFYKF